MHPTGTTGEDFYIPAARDVSVLTGAAALEAQTPNLPLNFAVQARKNN